MAVDEAVEANWQLRLLRLAWRVDKALERREGTERVFELIDQTANLMEQAGYRAAADWLRKISC